MEHLRGKVAIITGAGRGIGKAAAKRLAQSGAAVVISGRGAAALEETLAEIRSTGGEAVAQVADVTDAKSVHDLVETALTKYGRLDCAFNNAGTFGTFGLLEKDTVDNFDEVIACLLETC